MTYKKKMELIDKSALVAEIEKLQKVYSSLSTRNNYEDGLKEGRLIGYKDALSKICRLEVKEVDLEKEYEKFVVDDPILGNFITNDTMGMVLAKHFFELGLKTKKGD